MPTRGRRPSPILNAATAVIEEASGTLVRETSRFRHSFEAPLDAIRPDPDQPRKTFAEPELAALAATMAEQGQLQPILLRRTAPDRRDWVIVAGERRWRAARRNGWSTILAIEHDGDPEVAALLENLQRVDLSPVETARGLQRLIRDKGWSQDQAAAVLGTSKSEVSATLRILSLPEEVLHSVLTSELPLPRNVLVELSRIEQPSLLASLLRQARDGELTVKAIRHAREAPERVSLPPAPRAAERLDLAALDRLAARLRGARARGHPPDRAERDRLAALRAAIDALLG